MKNKKGEIAADSTFYICFLDDINNLDALNKILDSFKSHIPKKIHEEINRSKNWNKILFNNGLNIFQPTAIDLGKALAPFFSTKQIEKGESEIIVLAYVCSQTYEGDFYFVLDDGKPRKFIENNCKELLPFLVGTPSFVKICYSKYNIFNKSECVQILDDIGRSKFRIDKARLDSIKREVENS